MTLALRVGSALVVGGLCTGALFAVPATYWTQQTAFPHETHQKLFPTCTACHAGVVEPGKPKWPEPTGCASCHDGVVRNRVTWLSRTPRPNGNLKFDHGQHSRAATAKNVADSALIGDCAACHVTVGNSRMTVQHTVVGQCLNCHGLKAPHVDNPGAACATCHVRLSDAPSLTRDAIARFPRPTSHDATDFVLGGHGKAAKGTGVSSGAGAVAANCAVCHARNLCVTCHVNARELPEIRALALDDRPPLLVRSQPVPTSHALAGFLRRHGRDAQRPNATCGTCHARASCATCHVGTLPRAAAILPAADTGRAVGARLTRTPPSSHSNDFRERHGAAANSRPQSCATCHQSSTCLQCHRPDNGQQNRYHPQAFLTRHPSSAYAREANCSSCHNSSQFCQSCHKQSGLIATSRIGNGGYHDAYRGFSLGHGQAARQSLETCASCHAERDCTACHSAVGGGFRFSPHGPGYNGAKARAKNPSLCIACHGRVIPGDR